MESSLVFSMYITINGIPSWLHTEVLRISLTLVNSDRMTFINTLSHNSVG